MDLIPLLDARAKGLEYRRAEAPICRLPDRATIKPSDQMVDMMRKKYALLTRDRLTPDRRVPPIEEARIRRMAYYLAFRDFNGPSPDGHVGSNV
jgi:hypothetical protein